MRRPAGRSDDGILIIEESRGPSSLAAPGNLSPSRPGAGVRRAGRGRPTSQAPRRTEPTPAPRPLSGILSAPLSIATPGPRPLDLNTLSLPTSPLTVAGPRDLARAVAEPSQQVTRPAKVGDDYSQLVSTPAKLREAVLLSEILQPPLALRRRRRF
jgi:hypothetical protein